jgi:hypothetical protein
LQSIEGCRGDGTEKGVWEGPGGEVVGPNPPPGAAEMRRTEPSAGEGICEGAAVGAGAVGVDVHLPPTGIEGAEG